MVGFETSTLIYSLDSEGSSIVYVALAATVTTENWSWFPTLIRNIYGSSHTSCLKESNLQLTLSAYVPLRK